MVRNPHDPIASEPDDAPHMLQQPSETPPPLGRLGDVDSVRSFRQEWVSQRSTHTLSPWRRLRAWAGRISGRTDRRLLFAIAQATDAVAAHCDLIADRLGSQEIITGDVTRTFGEEISQLRSEVLHLQRVVRSDPSPHE
jgi:hypothetical protein